MKFTTFVLTNLHELSIALQAKLCGQCPGVSRPRTALLPSSPRISLVHLQAYWRLCPDTGHLVQQWDHADPQDPQSRNVSSLLAQTGAMLSRFLGARTA